MNQPTIQPFNQTTKQTLTSLLMQMKAKSPLVMLSSCAINMYLRIENHGTEKMMTAHTRIGLLLGTYYMYTSHRQSSLWIGK
jgi:hypothetical protein